jgi:glycosyltransferase involved in cell wall biosynthesis
MQIGIDASKAFWKQKTGVEWYSFYLLRELAKLDRINEYLLYVQNPPEAEKQGYSSNFRLQHLSWPFPFLWNQCRLSWEMLLRPPEVLFVPSRPLPLTSPKKSVVTIHDVGFARYPHLYSPLHLRYHRFAARFAAKHTAKLIVPSEFTKQELLHFYRVNPEQIIVIPHGLDHKQYRPFEDQSLVRDTLLRYDVSPDLPYFVFTGRLEEKKNILGMVKALEIAKLQATSYKLILIGSPGYGFEKVEQYMEEHRLYGHVKILGYVPEEDKKHILAGATGFLFPTFYEGFGMPILEAMSMGIPVITSRGGAHEEVAGDAAVIVDPDSPEEISRAMMQILQDAGLRQKLREKGQTQAAKFSWERTARETLDVLLGLVKTR